MLLLAFNIVLNEALSTFQLYSTDASRSVCEFVDVL